MRPLQAQANDLPLVLQPLPSLWAAVSAEDLDAGLVHSSLLWLVVTAGWLEP